MKEEKKEDEDKLSCVNVEGGDEGRGRKERRNEVKKRNEVSCL